MIVQICVGSSCHLKGSEELVGLFEKALEEYDLQFDVALVGSFCTGQCNRVGVTVQIDDETHVGVTKDNFKEFFKTNILDPIKNGRN
ncbi:MAG: (2Fe-2S) ferredoxin domain-containing protein [Ruminococcaceae bacterium]|nr:(2Fe-2S) ferredoxin domain-containing protein [Oscillospiraceae bacterium]